MPRDRVFTLRDFHFNLPQELIAQYPSATREESRLFVLNRKTGEYQHRMFYEIDEFLVKGGVLVLNDARVIHARIPFRRKSGGHVEIILTQQLSSNKWLVICNRTKRLKISEILTSDADPSIEINIINRVGDYLEVETNTVFNRKVLKDIGEIPLPPYIKREASEIDEARYQTVYSGEGIASAAPTAGLHFSDKLIEKLTTKGIFTAYLTLNVSWGTFQPVRDNDLSKHKMHKESFNFPQNSVMEVNRARREGRRVIAVGTTALRVLEATFNNGINNSLDGVTDIFIYPPYEIRSIDALITNFHTPYSTLLMLVAAFAGYGRIMDVYETAKKNRYRFFSYGDAMLIY